MASEGTHFGVLDNRFLAKSVGVLNPKSPVVVQQEISVKEVLELLQKNKIGCIAVVDVLGKLKGIFTERDALLKIAGKAIDLNKTPISQMMTKDPQTASMTTSIAFTLNMMSQGGYRHVPIVDDESIPVGMISVKDIVDFIAHTVTKDLTTFL